MCAQTRSGDTSTLSVVIVTMNSERFIRECLRSVLDQKTPFSVEVIVVDNASTDATPAIIRQEFPDVLLLPSETNAGFSAGNNVGIRASKGGSVLLLNPDTIVQPGALAWLMEQLWSDESYAGVGPKILNGDGSLQRTGVAFPSLWNTFCEIAFLDLAFPSSRIFGRHRRIYEDPERTYDVDYLQGSCLMIKRERIDAVGLLDEKYFMYFEEADVCYRLHRKGWKIVYIPGASIVHFGGSGSSFYDRVRLRHFYQSYLTYLRLHESTLRQIAFRVLLTVRGCVRAIVFAAGALLLPSRRQELTERAVAYSAVIGILLKGR